MKKWIVALWLAFATACSAATVELTWDNNPPEDAVVKYTIYYGNYSGNTRTFVATGTKDVTTNVGQITDLSPLKKWFFRVTATNSQMESLYSNMVAVQFIRTPANNKFQKIEIR